MLSPVHRLGLAGAALVGAALVGGALLLGASRPFPRPAAAPAAPEAVWQLQWEDDFDGPAHAPPDSTAWRHEVGDGCAFGNCGWGNEERQWYSADPANASLTGDGMLALTARVAPAELRCYYGTCRYTSAKLTTARRVEAAFGRVEARLRLPRGQGLWPAFWMLGAGFPTVSWPDCGELDIMEFRGSRPFEMSSALHGPGYAASASPFVNRHAPSGADFTRDFHRFAVEWDSREVRFFVDDVPHLQVKRAEVRTRGAWAFDHPFYLILNIAVGGPFDGNPASEAIFPATMLVDWVRVYSRAPTRPPPAPG